MRDAHVVLQFSVWESDSASKTLAVHWDHSIRLTSPIFIPRTPWQHPASKSKLNNKNSQEDYTKASRFGNTTRSPAELWKSGNPWQCDFCFSLCIKSRCQEPSPPQPGGGGWIRPAPPCPSVPSASPPTSSWTPDVSVHGSCGAPVTWKREEKERCRVTLLIREYTPADLAVMLWRTSNQWSNRGVKGDSTPLCYKKTSLLWDVKKDSADFSLTLISRMQQMRSLVRTCRTSNLVSFRSEKVNTACLKWRGQTVCRPWILSLPL